MTQPPDADVFGVTDLLVKVYTKHLDFDELVFCRAYEYGVIFNEAYEQARTELEARRG